MTTRGMVTATVVAAWICMMMVGGCARGVDGRAVPVADPRPVGFIEFADAGFSITAPPGWTVREDSDELIYGDVALTKKGDDASMILIGVLDGSIFASARADNRVAAQELGSGMGEFFFPDSGTRVDREGGTLSGAETTGAFEFYRVEFDDRSRSDAEVFSAVVEKAGERWWMTWLSNKSAVDVDEACELAESITPM
ncbi:APA family fibronectin-binding glycoprotein [Williamsia sp. R60]